MIQDDQEVFSDIIKVLDATNDTNCARALSNIVELVGRLARSHWLRKGKGDLWHATNSIWLDLRRQLDLEVHKTDPGFSSTSDYFKGKERADLRDLAFLAEVATYGAAPASQRARTELKRFLSTSRSESSPAYRAIELFNQLLGYESRPTPVREERSEKEVLSKWEMHAKEIHEETSGIDVPTLTSRRRQFLQDAIGVLNVQIGFREPDLHELMLDFHDGDEDAVFKILKRFDTTNSPRVKNSCIEALRLIGGCLVAQQLSDRVSSDQLYAKYLVLCSLDGLASQPYRPAMDPYENLALQRETIRHVLTRLRALEPCPDDLRAIRDSAIEGVERHEEQFR